MTNRSIWIAPLALVALSGCVARAAVDVVTLPVKAGAQVVDWSTTSQDEADRNYGKKMRKQEAREAKERKAEEKRRREQCREDGGRYC